MGSDMNYVISGSVESRASNRDCVLSQRRSEEERQRNVVGDPGRCVAVGFVRINLKVKVGDRRLPGWM